MAARNKRKIRINRKDSMNVAAAEIRDTFTFTVEVETEDGNYERTFTPSVIHIDAEGNQSVASRTEARPLTHERNFFLEFERREGEQVILVNIPIHELTVDEIDKKMSTTQWAARFKDDEKVSFLFIYRKTEDGWDFRRATERIFVTNDGNGSKRAKMAAHRSLAGGVLDADEVNIYVDHSMHKDGERCRRDGVFIGSYDFAMKLGGIHMSQEIRSNIRIVGNDGRPWHLKGDVIWSEKVKGGYDVLTCPCNMKRDGGLMVSGKIVVGTTGPQRQGEAVVSNAQLDASAGHILLDRMMYANGSLSVWSHQLMAKMGKTLSRTMLGKNPHFAGLDPEDQKLNRRADVAGYLERTLGDAFVSPAVTLSNIEATEAMYGEDSKHRVPVPGAYSYSLTAPEILDDMQFEGPRPESGEIAIYSFGFVPHENIFTNVAAEGGGADGDDHFAIIMGYAAEAFNGFGANELIADLVRFPQGARIHEGKVGIEHSLVKVSQNTSEFVSLFKRTKTMFPVLDFHRLPDSTMDLPTPEVEMPEPEETLSFMEEVRRLAELQGSYGRFSLRVTSLVYLATTFFDGELPEKYTLPISMEDAIDATTKHVSVEGINFINETAEEMTTYIAHVIKEHMDGKVDPLFAKRAGLLDSEGNLPDGFEETQWSMSLREEQWMWSYNRLCNFTGFLSEQYKSVFNRAVTAMGGYEKNSVTKRFWDGVSNRRQEKMHESQISVELGNSMAEAGISSADIQNLLKMQTMDLMGTRENLIVSETLFSLPMVEQTVEAVDSDLQNNVLTGMMDQVWTPLLSKIATSYDGDYRTDPFIGQVIHGFDRYFGGGFDNITDMVEQVEAGAEYLVSCMERAVDEAADLQDEYDDDTNIVLCGAITSKGQPCKNQAVSCPHH